MSEPKGPKVELPDELAQELESSEGPDASAGAANPADGEAPFDVDAERDSAQAEPAAELEVLRDRHLRLAAEQDIARHVEVVGEVEFLVDEADAQSHGRDDGVNRDRPTVEKNAPGVGRVHPAEDFHQCAFARPVLPDDREYLARSEHEIDLVQRPYPRELLRDAVDLEQGFGSL